jgi:hypothetical protein
MARQPFDYTHNAYLAVTLSFPPNQPQTLAQDLHPSATYVHQVGELSDVHLFAVPKEMKDEVVDALKGSVGVKMVEVVEEEARRVRVKRSGGGVEL